MGGAAAGRQLLGSFPPHWGDCGSWGRPTTPAHMGEGVLPSFGQGRGAARGPHACPELNRILPLGGGEPARPASPLRQVL